MAKENPSTKKVIKTEAKKIEITGGPSSSIASRKKVTGKANFNLPSDFTFNSDNIKWILISLGIVVLGYLLMTGGHNPRNVFDEKVIYSFRRLVIAPIVILGGLGLSIYAIFRNKPDTSSTSSEAN